MRATLSLLVVTASACGDNLPAPDAANADAVVTLLPDATIPAEATAFVTGNAPACSSATPSMNACMIQAASTAWGSCTVPAGFRTIGNMYTVFPAASIFGDADDCEVHAFVATDCGAAIVAWTMGANEASWSAFTAEGTDCWITAFGRVCVSLLPVGRHTIRSSSCSNDGQTTCFSSWMQIAEISTTAVQLGARTNPIEGCTTTDTCSCW
jgi:hypothetical protein